MCEGRKWEKEYTCRERWTGKIDKVCIGRYWKRVRVGRNGRENREGVRRKKMGKEYV